MKKTVSTVTASAQQQLRERLGDLWVRGVRRLPFPPGAVEKEQPEDNTSASVDSSRETAGTSPPQRVSDEVQLSDSERAVPAREALKSLSSCQKCPVCPAAKEWQHQRVDREKPYLLLVDFPFVSGGLELDFAATDSPNHLIQRLLERAQLRELTHLSYALKAPLQGAPSDSWVKQCGSSWLSLEVEALRPQRILVFGARALLAAKSVFPAELLALESGAEREVSAAHGRVVVMAFPSALELAHFPNWRQTVWSRVSALQTKR